MFYHKNINVYYLRLKYEDEYSYKRNIAMIDNEQLNRDDETLERTEFGLVWSLATNSDSEHFDDSVDRPPHYCQPPMALHCNSSKGYEIDS